jgi:hypothetical protein
MMARMKALESENARRKKMYIEEKLKAKILNEAVASPVKPTFLKCYFLPVLGSL